MQGDTKMCEESLSVSFMADILMYAVNNINDIVTYLNDDEITNETKLKYIREIVDDFYEGVDLRRTDYNNQRDSLRVCSYYLDNIETFEADT